MVKGLEVSISLIIALYPALAVYNLLPGTTLASSLLWLALIPLFVCKIKEIVYNRDEIFFFFWILLISVLSALIHLFYGTEWYDFTLFYHNLYSIILCLVPLFFITNEINIDVFVKTVFFFGVVASVVLIWQWLSLFFFGEFQKDLFIPGLEINRGLDTFSAFRPSAFFTEPAHFAIYMLPAFQIAVLYKKYILAGLFAFAILCSGSSTGFLLLFVLLMIHLYKLGSRKWYTFIVPLLLVLAAIWVVNVAFPEVFLRNFDKLGSASQGKSDLRLLGPLAYLSEFHFYEHLLGLTLNQLGNFLLMNGISTFGYANYANAIIYMYISFGFVGFILFGGYVLKKWKNISTTYGFLVIFLGVACSDQILFNGHYLYLLTFVLLTDKISNCQNANENVKK